MDAIASAAFRMASRILSEHLPHGATTTIVALMQPVRRSWVMGVLPIVGLITMMLALAALQLRMSAKVSEAERDRLQHSLQRSTESFQAAFAGDLLRICRTLQAGQPRDSPVLLDRLFYRYIVWRRMSGHTALISGFYIWPQSDGQPATLLRLDPESLKLEPVAWPESLHAFTAQGGSGTSVLAGPRLPRRWLWDEQVPALIHPLYALGKDGDTRHPKFFGYLFIVFNQKQFEQVYLPDLGRRYFPLSNGFIFQLVENKSDRQPRVVYQSGEHTHAGIFPHADAIIHLLDETELYRSGQGPTPTEPVRLQAGNSSVWQIAIRHRSGSVDAAVTSLRRRDLAVSMVVLGVLAVSLITILVSTRRAARFAQLQMEFASGVSHELRTPLAIISSAAENLADGVVTEGNRVRDYGALIHVEGKRLSGMVDHILDFARLQSSAHSYQLETVNVTNFIAQAAVNAQSLVEPAGIILKTDVLDGLPVLLTDPTALGQCVQNLLGNAVKYGSGGGQILLAVSQARENGEERILISVQDYGAGIASEELSVIWDPFYRGKGARDSQIRGTGLGLSVTREMMQALGGQVSVESDLGKGSIFTLHVPIRSR